MKKAHEFIRSLGTRLFSPEASTPPPALPAGFEAISRHAPEDVFVVGFPKSGNTWAQCLMAATVYGLDVELAPFSVIRELVPDVHDQAVYKRYRTPMFFKSHALPDPGYRRVIYLLRDGRDAMVSYFHYLKALRKEEIDFKRMVITGEYFFPCKWSEHVRQWLANPYGCEMIIVRFEDMKRNTLAELRRMCAFAGIERSDAVLEAAVRKTSFSSLRDRERQWNETGTGRWPKDRHFFRRGVVGSHADEMPADARDVFWREAGSLLIELGYARAEQSPLSAVS